MSSRVNDKEFKPLRFVGELHGAWYNKDGEVVDEIAVRKLTIYAPFFNEMNDKIQEEWPEILAEVEASTSKS